MQDLDIIQRNNAKAEEAHAAKVASSGRWVLAKYTGLNYHSYADFGTEAERNEAAAAWVNAAPGNRSRHLNPALAAA